MRIAICEDNPADLIDICACVKCYCEKNHFLTSICAFDNGDALLDAFFLEKFDIIFMDILMDGISGIDVARKIRETDPLCILIFITVSRDYALDAYSVDGIAYVLKPIQGNIMEKVLDKCRREFMKSSRFITVPVGRQSEIRLPFAGISYVEVYGREVWFHAKDQTVKALRMTLDEVEHKLGGEPFLRCHRCYIVNMNYVEKLQNRTFLVKNGDCVPIRQRGYSEIQLAFSQFITKSGFWGDST